MLKSSCNKTCRSLAKRRFVSNLTSVTSTLNMLSYLFEMSGEKKVPKYCGYLPMSTIIIMCLLIHLYLLFLGIRMLVGFSSGDEYSATMFIWSIAYLTANITTILTTLSASALRNRCFWVISLSATIVVCLLQIIMIIMVVITVCHYPENIRFLIFFGSACIPLLFNVYNLWKLIHGKHYQNG